MKAEQQHNNQHDFAWELRTTDPEQVQKLAQNLAISKTTARILLGRQISTPEAAKNFLNMQLNQIHDPFLMQDMQKACERIIQALQEGEKICIYGDYDVDGAVATSLLVLFFKELGHPVDYYIPNRLDEGYSLNKTALNHLKAKGTKLVITVDNAIMAHEEARYTKELGLSLIITDHHQVGDKLPEADAIINPQRKDCSYPFKGICGAGVAFKLMVAIRQTLRLRGYFDSKVEPNLKSYFDLLCIPTVCDVVPLVDENRIFVKEGLKHLAHSSRPGLMALKKACGLLNKSISSSDLGFRFGPRINACGRLQDATLGVKLLISEDPYEAEFLAKQLDDLNQERRTTEKEITEEALTHIQNHIDLDQRTGVVIYQPHWHLGVIGIVASRLVEKIHRPVFILTQVEDGKLKGSGRSIPEVNLVEALKNCSDCLEAFGGHEAAAGVTLNKENLNTFQKAFDQAVKESVSTQDLTRKIYIDDKLRFEDINEKLLQELKLLEPFGMGNARPVFANENLKIHSKRIVGENHLKLRLGTQNQSLDAIAFNKATFHKELQSETGALFGVEHNEFNGEKSIQLVIREFFVKTQND